MPSKRDIKIHNTLELALLFESICDKWELKPSTRAGAGLSLYVDSIITQAETEGIDLARRNLDRAIEMLRAMREAPHAEGMAEWAQQIAARHTRDVLKRDG